jgi:hypothetical protein
VQLGKEYLRMFNLTELVYDWEEILLHPRNYIIGVIGRQPNKEFFSKLLLFVLHFVIILPNLVLLAGQGFITLLHYPLFAYFPLNKTASCLSSLEKKGQAPFFFF